MTYDAYIHCGSEVPQHGLSCFLLPLPTLWSPGSFPLARNVSPFFSFQMQMRNIISYLSSCVCLFHSTLYFPGAFIFLQMYWVYFLSGWEGSALTSLLDPSFSTSPSFLLLLFSGWLLEGDFQRQYFFLKYSLIAFKIKYKNLPVPYSSRFTLGYRYPVCLWFHVPIFLKLLFIPYGWNISVLVHLSAWFPCIVPLFLVEILAFGSLLI